MDNQRLTALTLRKLNTLLDKEGKDTVNVITGKHQTILFRRGKSTAENEEIRIYYHNNDFISKGHIISYHNENYLVTNFCDTESDSHLASTCILCNQIWHLSGLTIPVLMDELTQPAPTVGTSITAVDGMMRVRTSDIDYFHDEFPINTHINVAGGLYTLVNKFFNNGVTYLYFQREKNDWTLTTKLLCPTDATYPPETTEIILTPYVVQTDDIHTVYVPCAVFGFETSDPEIAVCDGDTAHILKNGAVDVTVIATGRIESGENTTNFVLTKTCPLMVDIIPNLTMTLSVNANKIIVNGSNKTIYANFTDDTGKDITDNTIASMTYDDFVWTFAVDGKDITNSGLITVTPPTTGNPNLIRVKWGADRSYLDKTLTVTCYCNNLTASLDLVISAI